MFREQLAGRVGALGVLVAGMVVVFVAKASLPPAKSESTVATVEQKLRRPVHVA